MGIYHRLTFMPSCQYTNDERWWSSWPGWAWVSPTISFALTVHFNPTLQNSVHNTHANIFMGCTYCADHSSLPQTLHHASSCLHLYIYNTAMQWKTSGSDYKHHLVGWPQSVKSSNSLATERLLEEVHSWHLPLEYSILCGCRRTTQEALVIHLW